MQFLGIFSIVFGLLIIAYPQFLAYMIGFFFLILGMNILIASHVFFQGSSQNSKTWKIGDYEILKNNNRK